MQVAEGRRAVRLVGFRARIGAGGERGEDRVESLHRPVRPADHQAVAAIQPPDTAAGANIDEVDTLLRQLGSLVDRVVVVGIAAVDDGVALVHERGDLAGDFAGDGGRQHQPGRSRLRQF